MTEYAPPPPKVRITKAQLRKKQEAYKLAEKLVEDHSQKEATEKKEEMKHLEDKLWDVF